MRWLGLCILDQTHPASWRRPLHVVAAGLILASVTVCVIAIFFLSAHVRVEISKLARTSSDNTQWSLSQNEVELLSMIQSSGSAIIRPADLDEVRKRFDIFYSRMQTLQKSAQFIELRQRESVGHDIKAIQAFLDRYLPLIDGPPEHLAAALPSMISEAQDLRRSLRQISISGLEHFSQAADKRRNYTSETLGNIGLLTTILVLELGGMVLALTMLFRQSRQQAFQQSITATRLETVIATALDGVIVTDDKGVILDFNQAAEEIFGYQRLEVLGKNLTETIVPPHLHESHTERFRRLLSALPSRTVRRGRLQTEGLRKDQRCFPVEFTFSVATTGGDVIFVCYLRDISARIAAEQELVKARDSALQGEKTKAQFLAVMSHEMRTPLNGMLGTLELLRDTKLDVDQQHLVGVIANSGDLLLTHVNDVLDISRLDAGKMTLSKQKFDANRLVAEVCENQMQLAQANGNVIATHLSDLTLSHVTGDPNRLRQILLNLVGNAVKFTRDGHVIVTAKRLPDGTAEFRVQDSGVGISVENQKLIFDDFVTIDASYARRAGGTGLGLGIVRRLVKAMGGDVGVESSPQIGSLFWFRLPLPIAEFNEVEAESSAISLTKGNWIGRSVLVVEDNKTNRFVVSRLLEREGCQVAFACDGQEGVAIARDRAFDLILMDISMPRMDGVSATRAIRDDVDSACRLVPILALTAHALPEDLSRFAQAGMNRALTKPISGTSLCEALNSVFPAAAA